jgi:hypothetical protein
MNDSVKSEFCRFATIFNFFHDDNALHVGMTCDKRVEYAPRAVEVAADNSSRKPQPRSEVDPT